MMQNLDGYKELIPAYLAGKISKEDRLKLEAELQKNRELREELDELRDLSTGLTILEEISGGHISSELLAAYAIEPDIMSEDDRNKIEGHLKTCDDCREELAICQVSSPQTTTETGNNPLGSFFKWLFFGRTVLRPIYGLALLFILLIPAVYLSLQQPFGPQTASYEIIPTGARGLRTENKIVITNNQDMVRLEFVVPVLPDKTYDFELITPDGQTILTWPHNKPKKAFAVDVPTSYLTTGKYNLMVREIDGGVEQERFQFPLDIVVSSH